MPKLHETVMGRSFFDSKVPRIADALERIATSLEKLAATAEANGGKLDSTPSPVVSDEEIDAIAMGKWLATGEEIKPQDSEEG